MSRQKKGNVSLNSLRGMLRIRLPRHLYSGSQKYLSLGLSDTPINRQAAEIKVKQIELDIALGKFDATLDKYRPTFDTLQYTLSELWEKYEQIKARELSHTTLEKDFKKVRNHIASLPTHRLERATEIKNYLVRSLTSDAARRCLMQIKACCNWAVEDGLIPVNPFAKMRSPKKASGKGIHPFTADEIARIVKAFEDSVYFRHYTGFTRFLFATGCRPSEAIALQWKHISPDLKMITFSEALVLGRRKETKTGKTRRFPTNQSIRELLSSMKTDSTEPHHLVFPAPMGGPIDGHNFLNRAWKSALENAGVTYRSCYQCRHTFITSCLEQGVPVTQVAQWCGNSPRTIYQHYAGIITTIEVPEIGTIIN